jgi:CDP-diglyceride synthetase
MKKKYIDYLIVILGIIMFGTGLYFAKTIENPEGIWRTLPFILIGIGCGTFGSSAGNILSKTAIKKYPEIQKEKEIAQSDERNISIGNRAKAKAYDLMIFVYSALLLSFALMNIEMWVTLLLTFAYLFIIGYRIYYHIKYEKEM